MIVRGVGLDPPKRGMRGVRHHERSVGGKDGNRLVQGIDDGLAQFQMRLVDVAARHLVCDVLDQQRERAVGLWPRRHAIGDAAGQKPRLLHVAHRGRGLERGDALAPTLVVARLWHHPAIAHRVEHGIERGPPRQEFRRQLRQFRQRGIEELQPPLRIEDREADLEMRERSGEGQQEGPHVRLGLDGGIGGQGKDDLARAGGKGAQFHPDIRRPILLRGPGRVHLEAGPIAPGRAVEQRRQRPGQGRILSEFAGHEFGIRRIRPQDHAAAACPPDRQGRRIRDCAKGRQLLVLRPLRMGVESENPPLAVRIAEREAGQTAAPLGQERDGVGAAAVEADAPRRRQIAQRRLEPGEMRREICMKPAPGRAPHRNRSEQRAPRLGRINKPGAIKEEYRAAITVVEHRSRRQAAAPLRDAEDHQRRQRGAERDREDRQRGSETQTQPPMDTKMICTT